MPTVCEPRCADRLRAVEADRLVKGGIKDIQKAACQPDLEVLVPLTKAPGLDAGRPEPRGAQPRAALRAGGGGERGSVAALTFDARDRRESIACWFEVLESIRAMEAGEG